MRTPTIFVAAVSLLAAFGCASASNAVSDDASELNASLSCDKEIVLECKSGQFDGCLEPGLTTTHVCVAEEDRGGGTECAFEILRACDDGLVDACTMTSPVSGQHICVQDAVNQGGSSGSSEPLGCAFEILLGCDEGSFDGCLVEGLTTGHICVADADRNEEQLSCAFESLRGCDDGFQDACLGAAPVAETHICVKK